MCARVFGCVIITEVMKEVFSVKEKPPVKNIIREALTGKDVA